MRMYFTCQDRPLLSRVLLAAVACIFVVSSTTRPGRTTYTPYLRIQEETNPLVTANGDGGGVVVVVVEVDEEEQVVSPQQQEGAVVEANADPKKVNNETDIQQQQQEALLLLLPNTTLPFTPTRVVYSWARSDRSGASLSHMQRAHALAFSQQWQYGGACFRPTQSTYHKASNEALLTTLGLDHVWHYACPDDLEDASNFLTSSEIANGNHYSSAWKAYMKRAAPLFWNHPPNKDSDDDVYRIAVHIRRGDVTLCTGNAWSRYAPNAHTQRMIDHALADAPANVTTHVTIYAPPDEPGLRRKPYEDLAVFAARGYTLVVGGPEADAWRAFVTADALVMSKSTFSHVAAYMGDAAVYFTPFKHSVALPAWYMANETEMQQLEQDMDALQAARCPKGGKETDRESYFSHHEAMTSSGGLRV